LTANKLTLKRTKEEVILLLLCGLAIPSILPFAIIRLLQQNWSLAALDLTIVLGMMGIWGYVWQTRRVRLASIVVTVFYSLGMLASIYVKGQPIVYWAYPTMIAPYFMLKPKEALFINTVSMLLLVKILLPQMDLLNLSTIVVTLVLINLFSFISSRSTHIAQTELNHQAGNDFLTGAGNRRAFDRKLAEFSGGHARQTHACLLLLDLDHFKIINDRFGHATGDTVLIELCRLIRSRIRSIDTLFRYGGEEFVIVAIGTDLASAEKFAEELRVLIQSTPLIPDHPVTVSIGVAKLGAGEGGEAWFQRADAMLYAAKQSGRNAVRVAQ
jgi:diguanylate cyclase